MPTTDDSLKRERRQRVGNRLRELRKQRGLTQEKLAQAAGLDRSFYVEIENGVHSVALDRLFDIADALEVDVVDLLS